MVAMNLAFSHEYWESHHPVIDELIFFRTGWPWPTNQFFMARPSYKAKGILEQDPFVTLDTQGVGELILLAVERGRKARSGMKMGICGECLG